MVKKGFTLAEVLIAMAIVGVVSALVVPQVVTNTERQKTGLYVAKTVGQVEIACRNYLNKERDVQYTKFQDAIEGNNVTINSSKLSSSRADVLKNFVVMEKISEGLSLWPEDSETVENSTYNEDSKMIAFMIDTNGTGKKPNSDGKDRFLFYMNNGCRMIPYGVENLEYKDKCNPEEKGSITDYKTCAARLVRDGYKINYIK